MSTIGRQLRARREERGLSLAEVADALRINVLYIEAIEADLSDPEALPPGTYRTLYTTSYANYMGIAWQPARASEPLLESVDPVVARRRREEAAEEARQRRMKMRILVLVVVVIGIGGMVWWGMR